MNSLRDSHGLVRDQKGPVQWPGHSKVRPRLDEAGPQHQGRQGLGAWSPSSPDRRELFGEGRDCFRMPGLRVDAWPWNCRDPAWGPPLGAVAVGVYLMF